MKSEIGRRLVGHLLRANSARSSFMIDLLDERSYDAVLRELLKAGCLIVLTPQSFSLQIAAREVEA